MLTARAKLKKIWQLRTLWFKASYYLLQSNLRIHCCAFKKIAPSLGKTMDQTSTELSDAQLQTARDIALVIRKVSKPLFCKCLAQAMAAQILLYQQGISSQLFLGVNKNNDVLKAHAWLKCGERFITGRPGHQSFTTVAHFTKVVP